VEHPQLAFGQARRVLGQPRRAWPRDFL